MTDTYVRDDPLSSIQMLTDGFERFTAPVFEQQALKSFISAIPVAADCLGVLLGQKCMCDFDQTDDKLSG